MKNELQPTRATNSRNVKKVFVLKTGGGQLKKHPLVGLPLLFDMAELSAKINPSQVTRVGFKANCCQWAG